MFKLFSLTAHTCWIKRPLYNDVCFDTDIFYMHISVELYQFSLIEELSQTAFSHPYGRHDLVEHFTLIT